MTWNEWEESKRNVANGASVQLLSSGRIDDVRSPAELKADRRAWDRATEEVSNLRDDSRKVDRRIMEGNDGITNQPRCASIEAQHEVFESWHRYIEEVGERCQKTADVFTRAKNGLLKTDEDVQSAFGAIRAEYADTAATGGRRR